MMAAGTGRKKGGIPLLADGLKDEDIIKCALYGTDLPVLPLGEYAQEQLQEVALKLIEFSRNLLLGNIGISTDLQEHLDSMKFKAGKDSTTSSMKPSSDLFRKNPPSSCDNDDDSKTDSGHKGLPTDKGADNPGTPGDEADSEKKLRADRDRSLRTPSGTKPGRHNGETGKGFRKPENIHSTEEEVILPDKCMGCPHKDSCMGVAQLGVRHNIYDIEIHIVQKTVRTSEVNCPMDGGKPQKSDYPEEAKGVNQYGINIQTLICLLYCIGTFSIVGPVLSALQGDNTFLYTNSTLDLVTSTVFATTYGIGMILAAPILFCWQGAIWLAATLASSSPLFQGTLVNELAIVGGVLIIASGLSILDIKDCKTLNFIPALLVPIVWFLVKGLFV